VRPINALVSMEGGGGANSRMIAYLGKYCCGVEEISLFTGSAETVRLVMASFQSLSIVNWKISSNVYPTREPISLPYYYSNSTEYGNRCQ
jgi:hypothetical protein